MPFDRVEYGTQPLLRRALHQPDSRAIGEVLRRSLAASYGYCRSAFNLITTQTVSDHLNFGANDNRFVDTTSKIPLDVLAIEIFLPEWATHVVASVNYRLVQAFEGRVEVGLEIEITPDFGRTLEDHRPSPPAAGNAIAYESSRIDAILERSTQIEEVTTVIVRGGASTDNNETLGMRPQFLTLYWLSVG